MLVIGAGGLAKEILEIFHQKNELDNLHFYDDVSENMSGTLFGQFPILKKQQQAKDLFETDNRFILGVGNPASRFELYKKFTAIGGEIYSAISPFAQIGNYQTNIASGVVIMGGTVITNEVNIGLGCLINPNCTISHDSTIGDFVEISPGVQITGRCIVGDYCRIGTGAILLPKRKLGNNVTVGAGAVVTKDIPTNITVIGVPAKQVIKKDF